MLSFPIAWDTETAPIQPALLAPPLACISWTQSLEFNDSELIHADDPLAPKIAEELISQDHVGANLAYDLAVIAAKWPHLLALVFEALENGRGHDVIIRAKLADIGEGRYRGYYVEEGGDESVFVSLGYSLSELHKRYYGTPLEKDEFRLQYGKLRHQPLESWPEGARIYPRQDAFNTLRVWAHQETMPLRTDNAKYFVNEPFQTYAAFVLHLISCWGIRTDDQAVLKFLQKIEAEQHVRSAFLQKHGLVRADGSRDTKEAIALMRKTLGDQCELTKTGIDQYRAWWAQAAKTKTLNDESRLREKRRLFDQGYVSLNGDVCLRTGVDPLIEYARYGQHKTLYSKVCRLRTGGLPIQTSFESLLETGRTSSYSSKIIWNSVAVQNLPRKEGMRECFVPAACEVFVAVDYGMAELVSLAQVCWKLFGKSELRKALNDGMDPHLDMAATLLGISYAEAKARKHEKVIQEMRQLSKALDFGYPGGLGAEKFIAYARAGYGVKDLTVDRAKELKKIWLKKWPEMRDYFEFFGRLCEKDEKGLCDIKQYLSDRLRGRIQYTVACNTMFQGLTADAAKAALCECVKRCYVVPTSAMYGSRIVNFVHDENVGSTPEANCHEFAEEMSAVMRAEYQSWTPDVLIDVEAVAMRRWRKGAKPYKHQGRLVPYEDGCVLEAIKFASKLTSPRLAA